MSVSRLHNWIPGEALTASDLNAELNNILNYLNGSSVSLAGVTFTGDVLFTDATYDIGKAGATRPRDVFTSRNVTVGGTVTVSSTGGIIDGNAATNAFDFVGAHPNIKCSNNYVLTSDSAGAAYFNSTSTTASAANAFLNNASNNQLLRSTSSIRYKTDVQYLAGAYEIIDALKPMTYRSLAKADDPVKRHYGLLAEEVAKVEPALAQWTNASDVTASDEYLAANTVNGMVPDGVQYERIVVLLIAKIQSMDARLKAAGIA